MEKYNQAEVEGDQAAFPKATSGRVKSQTQLFATMPETTWSKPSSPRAPGASEYLENDSLWALGFVFVFYFFN